MLTSILPRTTTQIIKWLIKDAINPQLSSPFNLVGEWVLVAHTDLWEVLKNQWPCHKWLYRRFSTAKKMPRGTDTTFRWVRARNTLTHWSYVFLALTHRLVQIIPIKTLQWGHNGRDSISNHQSHDCLLNRLFRRRSKKTQKLRVVGLCFGEFTGDRWIPRTNGQLRGKCLHLMTSSRITPHEIYEWFAVLRFFCRLYVLKLSMN